MKERRDGMIRPMAVLGFSVLGTLTICGLLGYSSAFYVLGAAAVLAIISLLFRRLRHRTYLISISLSAVLASSIFLCAYTFSVLPVLSLQGKTADVTAAVCDYPEEWNGMYFYRLKTQTVELDGATQNFNISLSSKEELGAEPGDILRFSATFSSYATEYGQISRQYARSTYLSAYSRGAVQVQPEAKKPLLYPVLALRKSMTERIDHISAKGTGPLLKAMLLGNQEGLTDEQVNAYRGAGVAHLFAVSGLHLSIWSAFLLSILRQCGLRTRVRTALSMGGVLFFMALTGFSFSVLRAGIMLLLYDTSRLIRRDADPLNSLGTAVFLLGLIMPFAGMDEGLLLSFAATLGILTLGTYWNRRIKTYSFNRWFSWEKRLARGLLASLSISVSAALFTFPVQVVFFSRVSLYSPVTNLLVVLPASVFLVIGGILVYLSFLPGAATVLGLGCQGLSPLAAYMNEVTRLIYSLPGSTVLIHTVPILVWTMLTILLFLTAYLLRRKLKLVPTAAVLSILCLIFTSFIQFSQSEKPKAIICDVGLGSAVLLVNQGKGALIGCGGDDNAAKTILEQMEYQGIRSLDLVVVPRTTQRESSAWEELAAATPISVVKLPKLKSDDLFLVPKGTTVLREGEGDSIHWRSFQIEQKDTCVYITMQQTHLLLLTKAAVKPEEIPEEWRRAEIIITKELPKAALSVCSPEQMIVSTGKRIKGTFEWSEGSCPVTSTAGKGSIQIMTAGEKQYRIRREWN